MNRFFILSICLLLSTLSLNAQERSDFLTEKKSVFTLEITGLAKAEGEVRIAMFDSEEKYTKDPVHAVVVPVAELNVTWSLDDLPYGKYAIAVYHDRNENGKLDTNLLGIPKENYGFSNNARGRFGPASWTDSAFEVNSSSYIHVIEIR